MRSFHLSASRVNFRAVLATLVAVAAGVQVRHFIIWSPEELASRGMLVDDAYFYCVIARNFRELGFLTLDGTMSTNGVQPLWMMVQILLVKLFSQTDEVSILSSSMWASYVLFAFLSVWSVCRGRSFLPSLVAATTLSGLLILNVRFHEIALLGLEVPMALSFLVMTMLSVDGLKIRYKTLNAPVTGRSCVLLSLLATCCFLSRTDLFWVTPAVGIWLYRREGGFSSRLLWYLGFSALLVLPYMAFNLFTHDSLVPMSGRVKQFYLDAYFPTFDSYWRSDEWKGLFLAFTQYLPLLSSLPAKACAVFTVSCMTLLVGLVFWLRGRASFSKGLIVFTLVIVCHALFMQLVYRDLRPYTRYYFAPEVLWSVLVVSTMAADSCSKLRFRAATAKQTVRGVVFGTIACMMAAGSLSFAVCQWAYKRFPVKQYWTQRIELARDFSELVPRDSRVGAFWPGALAQFGERPVTPLDGIVGSNRYFQEYIRREREYQYMKKNGISHIAIFLSENPLVLFERPAPDMGRWSYAGVRKIWDMKEHFEEVVAFRGTSEHQSGAAIGWYLLKFRL